MAIRAQVPVVPMALIGTYELLPMHTYHLQPRPLVLVVGEPISTQEYTSKMADALSQRIFDTIMRMHGQRSNRESLPTDATKQSASRQVSAS